MPIMHGKYIFIIMIQIYNSVMYGIYCLMYRFGFNSSISSKAWDIFEAQVAKTFPLQYHTVPETWTDL